MLGVGALPPMGNPGSATEILTLGHTKHLPVESSMFDLEPSFASGQQNVTVVNMDKSVKLNALKKCFLVRRF